MRLESIDTWSTVAPVTMTVLEDLLRIEVKRTTSIMFHGGTNIDLRYVSPIILHTMDADLMQAGLLVKDLFTMRASNVHYKPGRPAHIEGGAKWH